jgi:AcrR family transcriptional regulator
MQPTPAIIDDPSVFAATRRERILDAAGCSFASGGYRAASLRSIASSAGCSLTLLDHHFGNKQELLAAVVKAQHDSCQKRLATLKTLLSRPTFELEQFISAWANYEFDLFATRSGRQYLTLMLRLQADREVDDPVRRTLNCAEPTIVQGFLRAWPSLDEASRIAVWRMASSALYAAVTMVDEGGQDEPPASAQAMRERAIAFLLDGLRGYCNCAPGAREA